MIILEGPDGGGKTTLSKILMELYNFPVAEKAVASSGEGTLPLDTYVEEHLKLGFRDLLFDRFALISGPIYGAQNEMSEPNHVFANFRWVQRMESMMLWVRPLIVYCLPPLDVVLGNLRNDLESQGVVGDRMSAIYWAYHSRAIRDATVGMGMMYDYTIEGPNLMLLRSRIELRRREPLR